MKHTNKPKQREVPEGIAGRLHYDEDTGNLL
jgi:hypothetical protein